MTMFAAAWKDRQVRGEVIAQALREFNERLASESSTFTVRALTPADQEALQALSVQVTATTPAFGAVFRLSLSQMRRYWRAFCQMVLRDEQTLAVCAVREDELLGVALFGTAAFPSFGNTVVFLIRLLFSIGPAGLFRYVRAVLAYEKVLQLDAAGASSTIRFIWLYAAPTVQGAGCGTALLSLGLPLCKRLGFSRVQAAVDAADSRLWRLYFRFGAQQGRRATMSGIELVEAFRSLDDMPLSYKPQQH